MLSRGPTNRGSERASLVNVGKLKKFDRRRGWVFTRAVHTRGTVASATTLSSFLSIDFWVCAVSGGREGRGWLVTADFVIG